MCWFHLPSERGVVEGRAASDGDVVDEVIRLGGSKTELGRRFQAQPLRQVR